MSGADLNPAGPLATLAALTLLAPALCRADGGVVDPCVTAGVAAAAAELEAPPDDCVTADVVVTGSRSPVSAANAVLPVDTITRAQIEASGAMSLGDLLQSAGNLRVDRGFNGATVSLRGLDARHTLILVDGQRLVGRVEGGIDLDRYPTAQLERVEIVRGAASAIYGADAVGGVINLITRQADQPFQAEASASGGTLGQRDLALTIGGTLGRVQTRWTVSNHAQDAFRRADTVATSGPSQATTSVGQTTSARLGAGWTLQTGAEVTRRRRASVDARDTGAVFDRTQLTDMLTARVGVTHRGAHRDHAFVRADLNLHRDQLANDQRRSSALDQLQESQIRQLGLTGQVDRGLGRHLLSVGVEVLGEQAESPRFDATAQRARGAVYVQDEWSLSADGATVLVAGARLDGDSRFGAFTSPRLALRHDTDSGLILQASGGRGFRAPEFTEMLLLFENPSAGYRVVGDPDLTPERAWTADAGATWRPQRRLELKLSGFATRVSDLIQVEALGTPPPGAPQTFRYANVAAALTAGVEAQAKVSGRYGWIGGGYTFTHARDLTADRALAGQAAHQGYGEVAVTPLGDALTVTLRGNWQAARPFFLALEGDGDARQLAPAFHTLDARVAWRVTPHVELFGVAQNLTDQGDPTWMTLPPARVAAGVTGRL